MKMYFSGIDRNVIEKAFQISEKSKINIMLSFFVSKNKPETLFRKIYNNRREIQKRSKK